MSKKVSVAQVLEALESDNIPLKRGDWFDEKGGVIGAACILGQAAINLGITQQSLTSLLNAAVMGSPTKIISLNDNSTTPYSVMVANAKKLLAGHEEFTMEVETKFYISKLKS